MLIKVIKYLIEKDYKVLITKHIAGNANVYIRW